jgi:hypothetical protein
MRHVNVVAAVMLSLAACPAAAQMGIPASVAAAEAEGAALPRRAAPAPVAPDFTRPSGGTAARKCVAPSASDADASGQLRSGEFLVRGRFVGRFGLQALKASKIYWMPLHDPLDYPNALLIRATRIGHPDDAFRLAVADWAYPGHGHERDSGFPSLVTFPSPGTWLVLATMGDDWGCFLFPVAPE